MREHGNGSGAVGIFNQSASVGGPEAGERARRVTLDLDEPGLVAGAKGNEVHSPFRAGGADDNPTFGLQNVAHLALPLGAELGVTVRQVSALPRAMP